MTVRRLRLPWLVDLVIADDAATIGDINVHRQIGRVPTESGPAVNRWIAGHLRWVLSYQSSLFPTLRARDDEARGCVADRLAHAIGKSVPDIRTLAGFVTEPGPISREALGLAVQNIVGQLLIPGFVATSATWRDACTVERATHSINPFAWIVDWITGGTSEAKVRLANAGASDPVTLHAVAIAVHNLHDSVLRMRAQHAANTARDLSPLAAAMAAVLPPQQLLRQATASGDGVTGGFRVGTLFLLKTRAAHRYGDRSAFMAGEWNGCPAHHWIMALLTRTWAQAIGLTT